MDRNVQKWLDNLPQPPAALANQPNINNQYSPPRNNRFLFRDVSLQSSDGSDCSSVNSVLESRKPDAEAVLIGLGFGPKECTTRATMIPERFLQPSQLIPHIDLNKFLEERGQLQRRDQVLNVQQTPSSASRRPHTC